MPARAYSRRPTIDLRLKGRRPGYSSSLDSQPDSEYSLPTSKLKESRFDFSGDFCIGNGLGNQSRT